MRVAFRPPILALAVAGVFAAATPAPAAWNNVFQVCCNDCNKPRVSYSAPCPQPCPQPEMRISYVQRSYYQPVTEYRQTSYYEPVTKNVTSYYYEPVTTYRYTTYYDPCTGCPQQVSTPCTSYRLRSQCNSVTSYVQRCAMVPVTTLRPVTVRQPVVSYYYPPGTSTSAFLPAPPVAALPPVAAPAIPPAVGAPSVEEQRSAPATVENIAPQNVPTTPSGTSFPRTMPPAAPPVTTRLRPERTTSNNGLHTVRGEVVLGDQVTPRGNAKLVFVNADNLKQREYVAANAFGEFEASLPAGNWYLYVGGSDGPASYHKQVTLGGKPTYDYRVVSR